MEFFVKGEAPDGSGGARVPYEGWVLGVLFDAPNKDVELLVSDESDGDHRRRRLRRVNLNSVSEHRLRGPEK